MTQKIVLVEVPQEPNIQILKAGKNREYKYVYHVIRSYRNKAGKPTCDRKSLGRYDEESGKLIPNAYYYERYGTNDGNEERSADDVLDTGLCAVVDYVMSSLGVSHMLNSIPGINRKHIATIVSYMLQEGNVMVHLEDFCSRSLVPVKLDNKRASETFYSLSGRKTQMNFFRLWCKKYAGDGAIAYDVTSFSSYSEGMRDLEWGRNRDGDRLPQINFAMYYGEESEIPLFFRTYAGSIVDVSHLPSMTADNEELGIDRVFFVMDRGFCSTRNVQLMKQNKQPFIVGMPGHLKTARETIQKVREDLDKLETRVEGTTSVHAVAKEGTYYGTSLTLHVFRDSFRTAETKSDILQLHDVKKAELEQLKELTKKEAKDYERYGFTIDIAEDDSFTFKEDLGVIDDKYRNAGIFCILCSDKSLTSSQVLKLYKRRDTVEKCFDDLKNHLEMRRLRTHSDETTKGKLFFAFIALIVRGYIGDKTKEIRSKRHLSIEGMIRELRNIRTVLQNQREVRLLDNLTKKQRELLECLDLDEDSVLEYARKVIG